MIGSPGDIVESTLVQDVSRPSKVADDSWIQPGRSGWSWFTQGIGTPSLQRDYIDFAARMDWEYVLIDARWDQWDDVETSITNLVDYAGNKGVRLLLWYNSAGNHSFQETETPRDKLLTKESRQAEFSKLAEWGVAGVKVDFFWSDKQDRIQQYLGILEDAGEYQLLVNFHGATLPRGWARTYPHLMTYEAVHGAETYEVDIAGIKVPMGPKPIDHVRNVFVRNVVGSMDYTPVVFEKAFEKTGVSYSHQLALSVLFESGIQHFADRADGAVQTGYAAVFERYPFVERFMADVPVVWDEIRFLWGSPDEGVVLARRHGNQWYVAGINGTDSVLTAELDLSFLSTELNEGILIQSGDTFQAFQQTDISLSNDEPLTLDILPRDGFTLQIMPLADSVE